jgi:hypothetical protein
MKEGSRVDLECGVEEVPGPPAYIYWYRHDQVLSYQAGHQLTIATSPASNNSLISKLSIKVHLLMFFLKIRLNRPKYCICFC